MNMKQQVVKTYALSAGSKKQQPQGWAQGEKVLSPLNLNCSVLHSTSAVT